MTNDHPSEAQIGAFLDNELPDLEAQVVAAHLNGCTACAGLASEIQSVSASLQLAGLQAPEALRGRLRAALAVEAQVMRGQNLGQRWLSGWSDWIAATRRAAAPAAFAFAAVALIASSVTFVALDRWPSQAATSFVTHDLMTAHLRALAQDGAIQVASSDQHTVKPWFAGKVDFSPEARDLTSEGFTLLGGRLDVVDGRRVGAMVYRRKLHLIDVFAWPAAAGETAPSLTVERGYGLLTWTKGGVVYWAVSDLEVAELKRLATLL